MRKIGLQFSADWQDNATNAALEERVTVADLRLWLNQQNVTQNIRKNEHRDHVTLSLYNLAEGLIFDWWRLFGGRDRQLSLVNYRSGYVVPDIRLVFDGVALEIWAEQRVYLNPEMRFWAGPMEVMIRSEAEDCLSGFVELVLDRLHACGVGDTSASRRWARVAASRQDPDEASFCESAGALGLDPYEIGESDASTIEQAGVLFEGEPLTEFLAGARTAAKPQLIQWVEQVECRSRDASRIAGLQQVAERVAEQLPNRVGDEPWACGYRRARGLRKTFDFDETKRFRTFEELAGAVGASPAYAVAPPAYGIRLLRSHDRDDVHLHTRPHGRSAEAQASQLFTFARGIGDVACFPEPQRAPVNDLRVAYRQAAGRAFATEFLAPVNEILSMLADGRDTLAIADEFAVSTEVIERQIENAGRIEAACS